MKYHPDWQGDIVALGFGFDRQMHDSFILDSVEIRPYSVRSMLESIWDEWTAFEGWSLRSINVIKGGADGALIRPLPIMFMWVVITFIIYQLIVIKNIKQVSWELPIIFCITGWLLLDILWQINLFRQNYLSYQLYAGKTLSEKRLVGPDAALYAFSKQVKKHFSDDKSRIFLTGKGLSGNIIYEQPRLQYFLMPYNVKFLEYNFALNYRNLEEYGYTYNVGGYMNSGDYLLVFGQDDRVAYNRITGRIVVGEKYKFNASLKYESEKGSLYHIKTSELNNP
jgi:hypothetical protein